MAPKLMKLKKKALDKYIATQDFNKLMSEKFEARLKQANLVKKNRF